MERDPKRTPSLETLRRRAESELQRPQAEPREADGPNALAHELEVQRVELQMQNEELRRAHLELQESLDRYYELYDLAPVGYLTLDGAGVIVEANLTAATLLGVDRGRLEGRPLASFMRREDGDTLHLHLRQVFDRGTRQGCEVVLRAQSREDTAAQRAVPVHIDSVAAIDGHGEPSSCRSVLIDLTALHRAEDRLRTSEAQSRTILDTAADAIVSIGATGLIESFNRAAELLFGYAETDVIGRDVAMLVPPPAGADPRERPGSGNVPSPLDAGGREITGVRKDGTTFPLTLAVGHWRDHGDRKFTVIVRDLSAHKQAERELRESEARFREIAEHLADAVLLSRHDPNRVVYASPAFETIFGRPRSELVGQAANWFTWVHPDDRARVEQAHASFVEGAAFDDEHRIVRTDGEVRRVRARMFRIRVEEGRPGRDLAVVQDVTVERSLAEELMQAQKMEAIGALAGGVAHDFNNVLQAVVGCINVARREGTEPERAALYLDRAVDAARRGGQLAGQLMAFARKQESAPVPIEIDSLLHTLRELLQRLLTEQIELEIRTGAPGCSVLADAVQVEQILLNLAANARDAMPDGGKVSITTDVVVVDPQTAGRSSLRAGHPHLRVIVEDEGVGMDARTRSRIFEPFFTTKAVGKGTGLGLATVFGVTQQLGGHIEVTSRPGGGTTFTLWFPCSGLRIPEPSHAPGSLPRFRGSVLLVEDDELVRMTVRHYLEDLGLRVIEADGAKAAEQLCAQEAEPPDLLLSDVVLPHTRGSRLAMVLRARYPALRVLLMSATPELAEQVTGLEDVRVLAKPFDLQDLAQSLLALLGPGSGHEGT